jgi:hypothetical protein
MVKALLAPWAGATLGLAQRIGNENNRVWIGSAGRCSEREPVTSDEIEEEPNE